MTHFDKITTKLLLFFIFRSFTGGGVCGGGDAWTAAWTAASCASFIASDTTDEVRG